MAQMIMQDKTMQETWLQSLGQENALEKEMDAHSSVFAWEVPWTEEPGLNLENSSLKMCPGTDFFFITPATLLVITLLLAPSANS